MGQMGGPEPSAINCTDDLPEHVAGFVRDSLADNSRRAYLSDLAQFEAWGGSVPASPEILASYRPTAPVRWPWQPSPGTSPRSRRRTRRGGYPIQPGPNWSGRPCAASGEPEAAPSARPSPRPDPKAVKDRPGRPGAQDRHPLRPDPVVPRLRARRVAGGLRHRRRGDIPARRSSWPRPRGTPFRGGRLACRPGEGCGRRARSDTVLGPLVAYRAGHQRRSGRGPDLEDQGPDRPCLRRHTESVHSGWRAVHRKRSRSVALRGRISSTEFAKYPSSVPPRVGVGGCQGRRRL
jgi:hypothetical protein